MKGSVDNPSKPRACSAGCCRVWVRPRASTRRSVRWQEGATRLFKAISHEPRSLPRQARGKDSEMTTGGAFLWKTCEIECGEPDTSYKNCLVNGHTIINTTAGHHFGPGGSCTGTGGALTLIFNFLQLSMYETAVVFTQTGSGQKSLKG
eukprot:COSAG06_NODE_9505_length_1884_cov_1.908123_2_plen_149_part_00